jgi:hypothetical protein
VAKAALWFYNFSGLTPAQCFFLAQRPSYLCLEMCASLGLKEQLVLEHHLPPWSAPLHPTTHPRRHLTIFHLAFPPENTHALTHSRSRQRRSIFILFPFLFYFWLSFLCCCFPLSPVCGWGSSIWPVVEEKNFSFAFLDIEKNLPLDDGQHMPLR